MQVITVTTAIEVKHITNSNCSDTKNSAMKVITVIKGIQVITVIAALT